MELLDEEGDLFGVVNAVDLGAVILALLVVGTGVGIVYTSSAQSSAPIMTQVVTIQATQQPAEVADAISTGPVSSAGIVAIENVSTARTGENYTVSAQVRLRVQTNADGLTVYNGTRVYIGRHLSLPLDHATLEGVIVEAGPPERIPQTPTISPTPTPTPSPSPTPTPTPTTRPTASPTSVPTASPTPPPTSTATASPSPTYSPTATPSPTPTPTPTPTPRPSETRVIEFQATVTQDVADSIEEGPVPTGDIVEIVRKETSRSGENVTMTLQIELTVTVEGDAVFFRGVELSPGQQLRLDLGQETVIGEVTSV